MRSNPNGANGTTSDPREQIMWDFYVNGIAKGRENAYESAVKAGYGKVHSENITLQGWFKERKDRLRRKDMLSKAERNLDKILDLDVTDKEIDPRLLSIKSDVSKTIAKTLGKNDGYSERTELTGKDGEKLIDNEMSYERAKAIIAGEGSHTSDSKK